MQNQIIELMHERVRAIHRALTGADVPEIDASAEQPRESDETITRRFAELEVMARTMPSVAERVPPFAFTPPADVIASGDAIVIELALPGTDRDDVTVERVPGGLVVAGIRRGRDEPERVFHAEIPRGPFYRLIPIPFPVATEPRTELDRGVLRIHLAVAAQRQDDARTDQPTTSEAAPKTKDKERKR